MPDQRVIRDPWRSLRPSILRVLSSDDTVPTLHGIASAIVEEERKNAPTRLRDDLISLIEDSLVVQNENGSFALTELGSQLGKTQPSTKTRELFEIGTE